MADRLSDGLTAAGHRPVWPVEANEVFVMLPNEMDQRLKAAGASYHPWATDGLAEEIAATGVLVRLVTSFATTADEVDRFVAVVQGKVRPSSAPIGAQS
jgi:threonine aldolase